MKKHREFKYESWTISDILKEVKNINPEGISGLMKSAPHFKKFIDDNVSSEIKSNSEKIYCYLNGRFVPPLCPVCNKNKMSFRSFTCGYQGKSCNDTSCKNQIKDHDKFRNSLVTNRTKYDHLVPTNDFDKDYIVNFIQSHLLRKDGAINGNLVRRYGFINKFGIDEYLKVFSNYLLNIDKYDTFTHYYYILLNGEKRCSCGSRLKFDDMTVGFQKFCSTKCSNNDKEKIKSQIAYNTSEETMVKRAIKSDAYLLSKIEKELGILLDEGFDVTDYTITDRKARYTYTCTTCDTESESEFCYRRCYTCNPLQYSKELEVAKYLSGSLTNIRSVLNNKRLQLDCYIPKINLAVEYDGLIWHSYGIHTSSLLNNIDLEDQKCHVRKTNECEQLGIKLFRVWSDEWMNPIKKDIWISKFNIEQNLASRVFARKTKVIIPTNKEVKSFLNENHLQGWCQSNTKFALTYNDEIISLMTVGKSRFDKSYDWELLRFCSKKNIVVVGGFSKLLSQVRKTLSGKMVSYANRRWSSGKIYRDNGFKYVKTTNPGYFYVKDDISYNRQIFQKHKLSKILDIYDESKTELDNMLNNGYRRLWDCGNLVYEIDL